jgi:hypothetical protein
MMQLEFFKKDQPKAEQVYVGNLEFGFGRMLMSHMGSPDIDALHKMADAIGISRKWFQDIPHHPHYDISKGKKALAIKLGAVEVSDRELIKLCYPDFSKKIRGK